MLHETLSDLHTRKFFEYNILTLECFVKTFFLKSEGFDSTSDSLQFLKNLGNNIHDKLDNFAQLSPSTKEGILLSLTQESPSRGETVKIQNHCRSLMTAFNEISSSEYTKALFSDALKNVIKGYNAARISLAQRLQAEQVSLSSHHTILKVQQSGGLCK